MSMNIGRRNVVDAFERNSSANFAHKLESAASAGRMRRQSAVGARDTSIGTDIFKCDPTDPQLISSFRNMATMPLSNIRRSIMTFNPSSALSYKFKSNKSEDDMIASPSVATEDIAPKLELEKKRRIPPLPVKLRSLNNKRFDELNHDTIIGKDFTTIDKPLSPRSVIIKECIDQNLVPFAIKEILIDSFVKMKHLNISSISNVQIIEGNIVSIDLHDMGLGDEKGKIFAKALPQCYHVHTLNLAGNRLTDAAMMPILSAALTQLKEVISLNVSDNKLDSDSIDILKADLREPFCQLQRLHLSKCDIDDIECT